MKINVTVDLSDFYTDEGENTNFSDAIKGAIAYDVKTQVLADFKLKLGDEFNRVVIAEIEKQKDGYIAGVLSGLVTTAKVKKRYGGSEMISISEYIVEELERTQLADKALSNFMEKTLKNSSDVIGKQLKDRYDMMFASQIVAKLHENGMLKDDVAKMLLNGSDSSVNK